MTHKLLSRSALLLFLGVIAMSASHSVESSEKGSASKESSAEDSRDTSKADTKGIEKLFLGTFKLTSNPKAKDFQKFLKAMGYKKPVRKMIKNVTDTELEIKKIMENNYEILVFTGGMLVQTTKFTVGKEFNDTLFDNRKYKATITFEGKNKMVKDAKHASGFTCHNVIEFAEKGFTLHLQCKGVKATQKYERNELKERIDHDE